MILASASASRLDLLRRAGFDPEVRVSGVAEDDLPPAADPTTVVAILARRKAEAVAAAIPAGEAALVVGCDSLLDVDGVAYGKPRTAAAATDRWHRMRGICGVLRTGHHLIDIATGVSAAAVGASTVHFSHPSDAEIDAYVASGEPRGVAGGFTLAGRGGVFVDAVEGDPSNVMGLSLPLLRRLLAEVGVGVTELWS
ncbi:MAG: Maf family protein [Acidimicrobiales bacterium]